MFVSPNPISPRGAALLTSRISFSFKLWLNPCVPGLLQDESALSLTCMAAARVGKEAAFTLFCCKSRARPFEMDGLRGHLRQLAFSLPHSPGTIFNLHIGFPLKVERRARA